VSVGDAAVVVGAGGIGQILIQILKNAGVRVAALSRSRQGMELAIKAGADLSLQFDDSAPHLILDFSGGFGAACAFECVGLAVTMKTAASCVQRGGQIIVIGEEAEYPAIDTIQIAQRELEIIGSRNGSRQDAADAIAWIARGIVRPPVVRRVSLEQINEGMSMVREGTAHGRVVVVVREDN
jgi:D-arabinose 1-dehydrogenase-like Zn-dependent alcohol dehydrogenase